MPGASYITSNISSVRRTSFSSMFATGSATAFNTGSPKVRISYVTLCKATDEHVDA